MPQENKPAVPQGGWTPPDRWARCKKCVIKDVTGQAMIHEGQQLGAVLSSVEVAIKPANGPTIAIATVTRCCRCGWVDGIKMLPGNRGEKSNAEIAGVTLRHIAECVRQIPLESYTIEEFKSGKIQGFSVKPDEKGNYNPNEWTEPEAVF